MNILIPLTQSEVTRLSNNLNAEPLGEWPNEAQRVRLADIAHELRAFPGDLVVTSDRYERILVHLPEAAECPSATIQLNDEGRVADDNPRAAFFDTFRDLNAVLIADLEVELADDALVRHMNG